MSPVVAGDVAWHGVKPQFRRLTSPLWWRSPPSVIQASRRHRPLWEGRNGHLPRICYLAVQQCLLGWLEKKSAFSLISKNRAQEILPRENQDCQK